jgi:hypothetical protein
MPRKNKKFASQLDDITLYSIDKSIVAWFETDFPVVIDGRKVPVLYATAERWARAQKEKGFRDEGGALMLPLISIRRTTPNPLVERYVPAADETNITLTRRIATSPISSNDTQPGVLSNKQPDPAYANVSDVQVFETLQIPFPAFVNLDYDVMIWTSYMSHQNINQENLYTQWKGGRQWLSTPKGVGDFFFFAQLKNSQDQSNLDDFSDKEKIIRYGFRFSIQAYLVDRANIKSFRTSSNVRVLVSEATVDKFPE